MHTKVRIHEDGSVTYDLGTINATRVLPESVENLQTKGLVNALMMAFGILVSHHQHLDYPQAVSFGLIRDTVKSLPGFDAFMEELKTLPEGNLDDVIDEPSSVQAGLEQKLEDQNRAYQKLHEAYNIAKTHIRELEAENTILRSRGRSKKEVAMDLLDTPFSTIEKYLGSNCDPEIISHMLTALSVPPDQSVRLGLTRYLVGLLTKIYMVQPACSES